MTEPHEESAGRSRAGTLHLDIEGCFNVRDAGGWATSHGGWMRTGALYRADDPVRLTPAGRRAIDALGLKAVIDLRQKSQVDRGPGFGDESITYHVPVVDRVIDTDDPPRMQDPGDIESLYHDMVERGQAQLVRAIDAVAAHTREGPVLVHCAAGKDRTGIVVALIQAAIGVPLESMVEEYALSDVPTRRRRQEMVSNPLLDDPPVARSPAYLWTAPAETMRGFASRAVVTYGSLEAWPLGLGLGQDSVNRLRAGLLTAHS